MSSPVKAVDAVRKAQQLLTVLQLSPPGVLLDEGTLRTGASSLLVTLFNELFHCELSDVHRPAEGHVLSAEDKAHNADLVLRALRPNVPAVAQIQPEAVAEGDMEAIDAALNVFVSIAAQHIKARGASSPATGPDPAVIAAANAGRPGTSHSTRRGGSPSRATAGWDGAWDDGVSTASSDRDTDVVGDGSQRLAPRGFDDTSMGFEVDGLDNATESEIMREGDEEDDEEDSSLDSILRHYGLEEDAGGDRNTKQKLHEERVRSALLNRELAADGHNRDERERKFRSRRARVVQRGKSTQEAQGKMLKRQLESEKCTRCPQGPALELERILASKFKQQLGQLWQEHEEERRAAQRMQRDAEREREERLDILRRFYDERCHMVKAQIAEQRREAEMATKAYIHETEKLVRELTESRKAQLQQLEATRLDRAAEANAEGVNSLCREIASAERKASKSWARKKKRMQKSSPSGQDGDRRWARTVNTYGGVVASAPSPVRGSPVRRRRRQRPASASPSL